MSGTLTPYDAVESDLLNLPPTFPSTPGEWERLHSSSRLFPCSTSSSHSPMPLEPHSLLLTWRREQTRSRRMSESSR